MKNLSCICKGLNQQNVALLIIRIGLGGIFVIAGIQKLVDMQMTTMMFSQMGIGAFWAWAVAIVETLGGVSVLLGMGTMIAAAALAVVMLVATIVMAKVGGIMGAMGPFAYFFTSVALVFSGAGKYSMESKCPCWKTCDKAGNCQGMSSTCVMNSGKDSDCACCGDSAKCQCDAQCSDCDCGKTKSTTKTMNCVCSNGVCVCDTTCEGCECGK
jgi:putative oxidoreductase